MKNNQSVIVAFIFIILTLITGCQNPKYYHGSKEDIAQDYAIDAFGQKIAANHDMNLLLIQNVTDERLISYCLFFSSSNELTLSKAKLEAAKIVQEFLQMLRTDPDVAKSIEQKKERNRFNNFDIIPKNVGLKISFWDKDVNRPKPPYIAEIAFYNSTFHYYEADPTTQSLRLVHKEPYQEAIANIPS